MKRMVFSLIKSFLVLILLNGCQTHQENQDANLDSFEKGQLIIGAKGFTEQLILLKITSIYLRENGFDVEEISNMRSSDLRSALENGHIDLYWEYTGTALMLYLNQEGETDPTTAYEKVKNLDQENEIDWLNKSEFNNTYAILVRKEFSEKYEIESISDLAQFINDGEKLKFASETEFYDRNDGLKGLENKYNFYLPSEDIIQLDSKLTYHALKEGEVDAIVGFVTDGSIQEYNLVLLKDDQTFFPAYNAVPTVGKRVLEKHEELIDLLNDIADRLNTDTMMKLNYDVDIKHKDPLEISRQWLESEGLLK
ncbi:glycine betaine ABC transporter substrate-binding protein [Alkalihalobacillus deserti]|uniref:glycine betaine ABC transporter substrate-binding protein n=1 Tax=Alkalihalobacillus deserti TaxID=2879466 RepID=UPI001D14D0D1|nr:glycine betaine ABC transporter substrate-binding protein [Alkalihalobacillus deserti]